MLKSKTLVSWDTEYNADALAWCPFDSQLLLLATYHVDPTVNKHFSKTQRKGRLYLLLFKHNTIKVLESIDCEALLDVQWCPRRVCNEKIVAATVDANGDLILYQLLGDYLKVLHKLRVTEDPETLALSLDFRVTESDDVGLVVGDSHGDVAIVNLDNLGLNLIRRYSEAHNFQVWYVAFDKFERDHVYSGGDDSRMKAFDTRDDSQKPSVVCKYHEAGVTSILSKGLNSLYSGSYDERLCHWDLRHPKVPLRETRMEGGGVWRIRANNRQHNTKDLNNSNWLLLACMHTGFHLVSENTFETLLSFEEHQSLAYGADIHPEAEVNEDNHLIYTIATCSFYDNLLKIWQVSDNEPQLSIS